MGFKRPKILIVDDHVENLVALERTLEEMDAELIRASSGNEALALTLDHEFALANHGCADAGDGRV